MSLQNLRQTHRAKLKYLTHWRCPSAANADLFEKL
jgi:hypothetical protein